jgi:DNA-binding NarL/FixJ family response regulator
VLKDTPPERLLAALKAVADGDTLFSLDRHPPAGRGLLRGGRRQRRRGGTRCAAPGRRAIPARAAAALADRAALAALTARETDVLRLVATGLSNGEIAARLVVSEGTVKTHLNRSMAKLNLSSRAQVVVLAYESGSSCPAGSRSRRPPRRPPSPPA